jgi:hypothetical protein
MARKVVLCTLGAGPHEELLSVAGPTFERWAQRHRYDLDIRRSSPSPERPPSWGKVSIISERLLTHDVVIWLDADAVVVDPTHDLSHAVSRRKPLALVAHEYQGQTVPNMGVVAVRSTRLTRRLMRDLWSMTQHVDHRWWENAALLEVLGYDISTEPIVLREPTRLNDRIAWLDVAWNSIDLHPSPAPFVKHYPGLSNDERRRRMSDDVAMVDAWHRTTPPGELSGAHARRGRRDR